MIKVIHKKYSHIYNDVVYIGRGSPLGNPFTSIQDRNTKAKFVVKNRTESIRMFEDYLTNQILSKNKDICDYLNFIYLKSKNGNVSLSCYCSPKKCHGDVVKKIIDSKIIKLNTK